MMEGMLYSDLSSYRDYTDIRMLEITYRECETKLGRPATNVEVCEELGITLRDLYAQLHRYRWLNLGKTEDIESLGGDAAIPMVKYFPFAWDEETRYIFAKSEFSSSLNNAVQALPKNEQLVVFLRYRNKLTMAQIAETMGLPETRVVEIHATAMLRIRPKLLELQDRGESFVCVAGEISSVA